MADGFVQVPPDSLGKKIETTEITRVDGVVVERQRFELAEAAITNVLLEKLIHEIQELKTALLNALH
jgi:hypothetical protein